MIIAPDPQTWKARQRLPLHERILALPPEVCELVHKVNLASGLDAVPVPAVVTPSLRRELGEAICGMPASVLELIEPLLLGVCLGHGLGSSGITDIVADAEGRILGCVVLLDIGMLAPHGANSWASWKENLPFLPDGDYTLSATIATPARDTRAGAMQYLLLHEFGHVLTAGYSFLPAWWAPVPAQAFSWLDLSWRVLDGRFLPHPESDFEYRGVVDFYGQRKLGGDALVAACADLEQSDFASLYGATNPYDDFAECFASYVHRELLGQPLALDVLAGGQAVARLEGFWEGPRSLVKRRFMECMLGVEEAGAPALAA
ncbi:hypothetical protein SRABI118_01264 [Massilia sp. Bi118]|uniref:hypothetical protein n=1 Tax=Massilia sp. Bi118 TaxID=2822346 RepID=UPI001DEDBF42|nr:hypothetical protein [Massilia sp. Bi118]CAH0181833.1 hypothetical protein SRABI118_01264 [Massilia sp. Bi118]